MSVSLHPVTPPYSPAYAMFISPTFCEYAYKLPIILGRSNITNADGFININTGVKDNHISRNQATITFSEKKKQYIMKNEGKLPMVVDGTVLHQGSSCVLKSGSAIKVSRSMFYFMLPKVVLETDPITTDGSQSNKIIPKVKGNVLSIKRVCESQQEDEIQKVKV